MNSSAREAEQRKAMKSTDREAKLSTDMDAELAATESEMASIIQSLIEKKKNKKKMLQEEDEVEQVKTCRLLSSGLS